jgi:hypothetical protein
MYILTFPFSEPLSPAQHQSTIKDPQIRYNLYQHNNRKSVKETLVLGKSEDKLIRQQVIHSPTDNITLTVDTDRVSTGHQSDRSS